ncbi:zinc-dependent peptidase [Rubritalea tangerina]|uniref:Zinc-dependent peptidase n=2 Tax=Rubritalea tangerina TaxID=430798 RepID=A0ABW4Z9J1_9BACT
MAKVYTVLFIVVVLGIAFAIIRNLEKRREGRRAALLKRRFSAEEREEIGRDFDLYKRLPDDVRDELDGLAHVFIEEKFFEPCGGLEEVTGHMQRVIACQACLLIVRAPHHDYEKLRSILVYPEAYRAPGQHGAEDVRLGESWGTGSVVLSWGSVVGGGRNSHDGHDVVLHEFAHQLDQADGAGDGVPELESRGAYREWAAVFKPAFDVFQQRVDAGERTVIDDYGAENPAEFFAVVTETFYEKPKQLRKRYPALYAQLVKYYGVDPESWH